MNEILRQLGIKSVNAGACAGPERWIEEAEGEPLPSLNPASNQPIASVVPASAASYDAVVAAATASFQHWRALPAPKRGELIRDPRQCPAR